MLVDPLDPLLSFTVAPLQGIFEWLEPRVELEDAFMRLAKLA